MLGKLLIRAFVAAPDAVSDVEVRARYGLLEGWTSVVVNLLIFVAKIVPGILIGSVSVLADAFHSLSDVLSSGVVIWGFKAAAKPSDKEHPFGHGRAESIASLVIAVLLLVAAVEFAKASVVRLLAPRDVHASLTLLLVLAATLIAKEWLARFSRDLGRRIGSTALHADFWHHRSDALSTAIVILALVGSSVGAPWLDGAGGVVVSLFLAWAGVGLIRESVDPLIGEAPTPALVERIRRVALAVDGVDKVHDIIVHHYGGLIVTSLHIEVAANMDVVRGHELAEDVERTLMTELPGWATVHVDPVNRDHPLYGDVEGFLERRVPELGSAAGFHDLRIVGREDPCFVIFDLAAGVAPDPGSLRQLESDLRQRFPTVAKVVVNVEPSYVYQPEVVTSSSG